MDNLRGELDRICAFLKPYLPLVNSHTVDFIVNDSWRNVIPDDIRTEVDSDQIHNTLNKFWSRSFKNEHDCKIGRFIDNAKMYELESTNFCISLDQLNFLSDEPNDVKITEFMSDKKLHEVENMSRFVTDVALASNISLIVDIGSGKGYLSSVLALQHGFKILGMDCSQTNISGATKTTMKLERKWKVYKRQTQNIPKKIENSVKLKEPCSSHEEYYNKYRWRSAIIGDVYKQRLECISKTTNIADILKEEYPQENHQNVFLVGLHTCGNLAPFCLEMFINNRNRIKSIVNIGCCYHLIEEQFAVNPDWLKKQPVYQHFGFPMSDHLFNQSYSLGRDARMCGTQKPLDFYQQDEITNATKPLFYRALLQHLMIEKLGAEHLPQGKVGRLAHKCKTFSEYATKALKNLNTNLKIDLEALDKFEEDNILHWHRLKIFFLLKSALSPVIEAVILLDRLLYLYEKDVTNAFIVRLFDPVISPRCYAVVALPSNVNGTVINMR